MCRYIKADLVVGNAFIYLAKNNRYSITVDELFKFENEINELLNQQEQTVIEMSVASVYDFVDQYKPLFSFNDSSIVLNRNYEKRLQALFRKGLPIRVQAAFDRVAC